MKAYSIGRDQACDIVINDNTDVISRRHAILNVSPSGKMTIVDQSHNGTYVNGIRISANVPVPVTRKDNISFAHISRLDWNMIPKPTSGLVYGAIAAVTVIVLGAGAFVGYKYWPSDGTGNASPVLTDSALVQKKDSVGKKENELKKDSINKDDKKSLKNKNVTKKPERKDPESTGKEPKKTEKTCPTCKKPVSKCEHKGKHPENNTRGDR